MLHYKSLSTGIGKKKKNNQTKKNNQAGEDNLCLFEDKWGMIWNATFA